MSLRVVLRRSESALVLSVSQPLHRHVRARLFPRARVFFGGLGSSQKKIVALYAPDDLQNIIGKPVKPAARLGFRFYVLCFRF